MQTIMKKYSLGKNQFECPTNEFEFGRYWFESKFGCKVLYTAEVWIEVINEGSKYAVGYFDKKIGFDIYDCDFATIEKKVAKKLRELRASYRAAMNELNTELAVS